MPSFAGTVIEIENGYSFNAPGSPAIAAPFVVVIEFAIYEFGRVIFNAPVPSLKVNFAELDTPEIVTTLPVFSEMPNRLYPHTRAYQLG